MRPGQVIGHYRLVEKIGEGSTGSVWKADDRRLRRTVALKILRGGFDGDTETLARFRKESRFLARIDHPGVAAIHDVEEYAGRPVLVLEFVPGESLAEYLAGGPLALTEALRIGIQVASTVHAAHLSGIIHRDLKPGNIKITPDGTARVLDFGLAKSFGASGDTTESSTVNGSFQGTVHGTILGTASYMSPEQARGQSVDQRTDLWSLGCVLFEALSGRKAFPGETMLDTLATVLEREPDWSTLPGNTPDRIHHLLRWCLCKDVGHRLRDMGDAAWEMKQALVEQDAPGPPSPEKEPHTGRRRRAWRFAAAAGAGALLGLGALIAAAGFIMPGRGAVAAHRGRPLDMYAIHLEDLPSVALGDGAGLALSRDGTRLALAGGQVDGSLLIRRMDRFTPRAVPETDGAALPFFSPAGTAIGFFRGGSVWRVDVTDSTPIRLASAAPLGGAWGDGGRIVFAATDRSGLLELDTRTGTITPVTHLDPARDEISHRWPTFLPGGGEVLFNIVHRGDARGDEAEIALLALDTGRRTTLIDGGTRPAFVAPRHLLFSRAGSLMAVPLGPDGRHPAGTPFTVVESLRWSPESGATGYALSRADPILVYTASHAPAGSPGLAWFDAAGRIIRTHPLATPIHDMRIAPGGDRLAATVGSIQAGVALESIGAGHPLRDLAGPAGAHHPVWSPDGSHLAFSITEPRGNRLMTMRADGSDTRSLPGSGRDRTAESWSVDGASLAFSEWRDDTGLDLLIVHPSEPGPPAPLHASPYNEREARFSPVGGWLAYTSDESERTEVYVERFPGGEDRLQVSSSGGSHPFWSADGSRLYYRQGDGIYAVTVKLAGSVSASAPCRLFTAPAGTRFVGTDRTGDLVAVRSGEAAGATRVEVMAGFAHALSHSSRAATTTVAVRQP